GQPKVLQVVEVRAGRQSAKARIRVGVRVQQQNLETAQPRTPAQSLQPGVADPVLMQFQADQVRESTVPDKFPDALIPDAVVTQIEPDQPAPQWRGGEGRQVGDGRADVAKTENAKGRRPVPAGQLFPEPANVVVHQGEAGQSGEILRIDQGGG